MRTNDKIYGFKVKLYQLRHIQEVWVRPFLRRLQQNEWRIIYLERRNLLRQAISEMVARTRDQWHDTTENPLQGQKVPIDPQQLLQKIEWLAQQAVLEKEILNGVPHLYLVYEDDLLSLQQHQTTADRVFRYLGVEPVAATATFSRTTPDHLADFVENYEQVVEVIQPSKYAHFLDD